MKLLIVEDSRFLRLSMEKTLLRAGYQVIAALDGDEALELARKELPDAILLDLLLPKMNGLDVLKILKLDKLTRAIPVIVLTSLSQKNAAKLEKDGAAAYLEKNDLMFSDPASASSLVAQVKSVLGVRAQDAQSLDTGTAR
jgi:CheY-like chemotaxis protein